MFKIEKIIKTRQDADRLSAAFYRFLETNPVAASESAWMGAQMNGHDETRTISFWSAEAAIAFDQYLTEWASPANPRPVLRSPSRFDDLLG